MSFDYDSMSSETDETDFKVILHLCSAHLMHSIGFIVRAVEITCINKIFQSLCYVLMSSSLSAVVKTHTIC